jgi:hypothetical protein
MKFLSVVLLAPLALALPNPQFDIASLLGGAKGGAGGLDLSALGGLLGGAGGKGGAGGFDLSALGGLLGKGGKGKGGGFDLSALSGLLGPKAGSKK